MLAKSDLFNRPTISGSLIACVIELKCIGSIEYVSFVDEHGFKAMIPTSGLTKKPVAVTVGENERELTTLGYAMRS